MKLKQKDVTGVEAVAPRARPGARLAAAVAGTLALLAASPEQIYINGAPIPSAFTI